MTEMNATEATEKKSLNFIEQAVENDLREGKNGGKVQTRFPPEPNGYLHPLRSSSCSSGSSC